MRAPKQVSAKELLHLVGYCVLMLMGAVGIILAMLMLAHTIGV